MSIRWNEIVGIFLAALATLLFEITATKIFGYSVWANYAYLVISTAMFGLGFSGVLLTRFPRLLDLPADTFLGGATLVTAAGIFTAFLTLNHVPIHLPDAPNGWAREMLNVGVVFFMLAVPYIFFGFTISYLLHNRARKANVYYFADLVGAGLGAVVLVPLVPILEPQGLVVACAACTAVAALLFFLSTEGPAPGRVRAVTVLVLLTVVGGSVYATRIAEQVPLNVHAEKRFYKRDLENTNILASAWSALSRIDIAPLDTRRLKVWIAGGVNESSIYNFDGDYDALRGSRDQVLETLKPEVDYHVLPHLFKTNHTVCVIGTSGGSDSVMALMCGAEKVVGVEMDPQIVRFVTEDYSDFAGRIFRDGRHSEIVVDEGRSFLRRSGRKFDVIQQVNNFTPIAFQNGALNLSENYLLTVESFQDFHDHLTDDGIIAISRWGAIRVMSLAIEMFRRMGMTSEEYRKHIVVTQGHDNTAMTCMIKKSPFTREEVQTLYDFFAGNVHSAKVLWAPHFEERVPVKHRNLYYQMVTAEDPSVFYHIGSFTFEPTTDNKPFFNHFQRIGRKDQREQHRMLPYEIVSVVPRNVVFGRIARGDLPPFIILFEALVLSTVFFGLPLLSKRELRQTLSREFFALGYFACLGLGFILIEICLMQKLILFLGAPVYSIALVLGSILVFAGVGSLVSGVLPPKRRTLAVLLPVTALVLLALHELMPWLTSTFLGAPFAGRVAVATIITGIAGLFMGTAMPTAIRYLAASGRDIIPWAWATNGYFTVVGSALTIILAVNFGFGTVFTIAAAIYAIAPLFLITRNRAAA